MIVCTLELWFEIMRQIDLQKMPILAEKKIVFSDEAHFDIGGYVNKKNCRIWSTENPHAYIEKPTHPKRATVWFGFWSRSIFENEQGKAVKSTAIVIGRRILSTFGFNRTALHATQPKLQSVCCDLFLKIALSVVKAKYYADKPEIIDALKDKLHIIGNVLKN